jgi:hypothetical protein
MIHEAARNVISCPFRVISWIVLAQGKTTRNQFRALPFSEQACDFAILEIVAAPALCDRDRHEIASF